MVLELWEMPKCQSDFNYCFNHDWGAYFGVLGMFLAVPVAAIIKIIVSEWLNESKENDKIVDSIEF